MSRRVHPSFERLMLAFGRHAGVDERAAQAEIARRLKLSPQRVTNWKTRGVSKEGALELERQTGVAAQWVLDGVGPTKLEFASPSQITPPITAALPTVLDAIRACPASHREELRSLLSLLVDHDAPAYRQRLAELLGAEATRLPVESSDFQPPVPKQAETR
jgi:ribose 1,5-bisphosphokinase PhnN